MSAATMQSAPAIPPRPSRSPRTQEKDNGSAAPSIPPRPTKSRFNRSLSPNPDRFAPSPLNEGTFPPKSPGAATRQSPGHLQSHLGEELERSKSVEMPGVGEEGLEYAAAIEELVPSPDENPQQSGSPEQTRAVGEDIKLHAPKPTVPAQSARQRVATVTRTDSERAASFGIGRPTAEDQGHPARSLKKKTSTTSQLSYHSEIYTEDEHGIPEIGQRVPMLANAGDVQAPSSAPPRSPSVDSTAPGRNHHRKVSSRSGFNNLPPDSYGLHGHGVASTDKLGKAYYEKRPDALQKESYDALHGRVRDYRMSSDDLNKIVRDTASHGAGFGTSSGYIGTPSEQVGFQATDEYAARISSRPSSTVPGQDSTSILDTTVRDGKATEEEDDVIHVDDPERRKGFVKFGDEESAVGEGVEEEHTHPILASDEVAKGPSPYELKPAVEPRSERHGSAYEMEEPRSRSTSRPASIYSPPPPEIRSTPLDDVEEYEPLFPEDDKSGKKPTTQADKLKEQRHRFPSRDIWEDAPNSVHTTAEVSTPEPSGARSKEQDVAPDIPPREGETPAQAFARRQEELAEKEGISVDAFLHRQQKAPSWAGHNAHVSKEIQGRPNIAQRFPSRDVWEDTPDSLQFTTTVSTPQSAEESQAEEVNSAAEQAASKPTIPLRPKKQGSEDDTTSKPTIPGRPKPQIPARPSKSAGEPKESQPATKPKPAVPARPGGGKIAALQAGFMSDLNKRLQLGPQAPKNEETTAQAPSEEKERAPLSDARKGRARGPQRRAPTKSSVPSAVRTAPPPVSNGKPILSFSMARTLWSIDEEGTMTVDGFGPEAPSEAEPKAGEAKDEEIMEQEDTNESKREAPSEKEGSETEIVKPESKPSESKLAEDTSKDPTEETKTLATNTAGESILEKTIKKEFGDQVEKVEEAKAEVGA
ncbi:altered inheritance of mitochondria protein 21 [Xylariaceae sp. FL0662B]|nr:altered inheritance of mitochondria protein 21 [Xylariaceae sp. FL0662B]